MSSHSQVETIKPPISNTGVIGWMRNNLFNGIFNSIATVVIILAAVKFIPRFVRWAFIDSVWFTSGKECHQVDGACWSVVTQNIRFNIFGYYPYEHQWRPLVAMIILVFMLVYSRDWKKWNKKLGYAWLVALFIMGLLMKGGLFGLVPVESTKWSGLPLTLLLSFFGILASYPLGVFLALGRQSTMPVIKAFCIVYIEVIRGVPLITMLFMSSVMFPLFLPEGVTIDKVLRAQVAIIIFTAAYIAEVVRGGLQAMDKGQYEAAESLGLNYFQKMRLIILPQALKIVIPPTVGVLISAFKDTSLVVIIALYDILNTTKSILNVPEWTGFSTEAYIFIALIYYMFCFSMSQYSRHIESELEYKAET
ncbi:amino acid ABC transporter permease [Desulfomarina profundi]|uniref:Amino acid ABC transporter permease n=1 Tax=Desulfomarina profundi TaxID=2772557 RepID=A0A8D5FWB2_9BACT|nr:amino acid ABC transporter permease [Desulfomarina profundi]BCL61112.1 amino acid ABC transporter permease [Desulfomarina profundi]